MSRTTILDINVSQGNPALSRKLLALVILVAVAASLSGSAFAGTKEWDGFARGFDANWTTNDNWHGIGGAGPGDDLLFRDEVCSIFTGCHFTLKKNTSTNDFPINTSFNSLSFSGSGYNIRGNQIFLQNGLKSFADDTIFVPNIILGASQTWQGEGVLDLDGVVHLNAKILTVTGNGEIVTNNLINGTGTIVKTGNGTFTVNGSASSFGPVQVNDGTVRVGGSLGFISLQGGALSGTGSVKGIFGFESNGGGTISPGNTGSSTGRLRSLGPSDVNLSPAVVLVIDLNGPTVVTQHDQFRVSNSDLNLNGANLELRLGFTPVAGQQFTIVSLTGTGTIFGQFEQGISIVENNQLFAIDYTGLSVVLTALGPAVP